jgi:hypothetical protein
MKRVCIGAAALLGIGVAVVLSGGGGNGWKTFFPHEQRNPVTHLRWNDDADEFRFAVVSDRTGGHRAEIFSQAVEKLNLLQPEFVVCVGDLIEGGKQPPDKLAAEWREFDAFVNKLQMPFFYAPGNHDVGVTETAKAWDAKLGRRYYHFVYRNVLFMFLNADDPPGTANSIGKEQVAYAQKTLAANAGVRWTFVTVHRPLWNFADGTKNGWADIENALAGRSYTVFCGHEHNYRKFVRRGMNYYQLATTGGDSLMRGPDYGEFDHLVWVTMKQDGPLLANILLDSVHAENLQKVKTVESGHDEIKPLPTHPVRGRAFFEGTPMSGAKIVLTREKENKKKPTKVHGTVEADGTFKLSTYTAFDGAPAGEYQVSIAWREADKDLLPERYRKGLRATFRAESNDLVFELKK